MQPVTADSGDQDEEADDYVFFVDSKGEIVGLFHKEIVKSWREDPQHRVLGNFVSIPDIRDVL
jgi:hypothetical protein